MAFGHRHRGMYVMKPVGRASLRHAVSLRRLFQSPQRNPLSFAASTWSASRKQPCLSSEWVTPCSSWRGALRMCAALCASCGTRHAAGVVLLPGQTPARWWPSLPWHRECCAIRGELRFPVSQTRHARTWCNFPKSFRAGPSPDPSPSSADRPAFMLRFHREDCSSLHSEILP